MAAGKRPYLYNFIVCYHTLCSAALCHACCLLSARDTSGQKLADRIPHRPETTAQFGYVCTSYLQMVNFSHLRNRGGGSRLINTHK